MLFVHGRLARNYKQLLLVDMVQMPQYSEKRQKSKNLGLEREDHD